MRDRSGGLFSVVAIRENKSIKQEINAGCSFFGFGGWGAGGHGMCCNYFDR